MIQYTKEFREQAVLLSDEIGEKKVAEQLGVFYNTLSDWRKRRNSMRKTKLAENTEPFTEREKHLMKEIAELREANEYSVKNFAKFLRSAKQAITSGKGTGHGKKHGKFC